MKKMLLWFFLSFVSINICFAEDINNINGQLLDVINSDIDNKLKKEEIIKLIEKGADVNAKTEFGLTALMLAAAGDSPEIIDLLINAGADVNAKITKETNPNIEKIEYTDRNYTQKYIIKYMHDYNIEELSPISIAIETSIKNKSSEIAWLLYRKGAIINRAEYTDICILRLEDIGNPEHVQVTSDEYVNKILRGNLNRYNDYLQKCNILVDAGVVLKDLSGKYKLLK